MEGSIALPPVTPSGGKTAAQSAKGAADGYYYRSMIETIVENSNNGVFSRNDVIKAFRAKHKGISSKRAEAYLARVVKNIRPANDVHNPDAKVKLVRLTSGGEPKDIIVNVPIFGDKQYIAQLRTYLQDKLGEDRVAMNATGTERTVQDPAVAAGRTPSRRKLLFETMTRQEFHDHISKWIEATDADKAKVNPTE